MVDFNRSGTRVPAVSSSRPAPAMGAQDTRLAKVLASGLKGFATSWGQGFLLAAPITAFFQMSSCIDAGIVMTGSRGPEVLPASIAVILACGAAWGFVAGLIGGADALTKAIQTTAAPAVTVKVVTVSLDRIPRPRGLEVGAAVDHEHCGV